MASVDVQRSTSLGFSVQTQRFQTLGLHPELLTRVKGESPATVAPGSYNLLQYGHFNEKNVQKRAEGPNWQQALYTEQMAKIPHSTYKETYEKYKEQERQVGPGSYKIDDFLAEAERRPRCNRGALDQLTPRFPPEPAERAPPPGAYGVPDEKFVATRWQQGSNIPPLEWRQGLRTLPLEGSKIGPGTYNLKGSIDELIKKRTGERGPYQLFTINRSAPINTGHYATVDKWDLSPDFPSKDFPDSISLARQLEKNKKQGAFGKLDRFQKKPTDRIAMDHPGLEPKNVDFPGPGHYATTRSWEQSDFHEKKVPFNTTASRNDKRSFTNVGILHAVGVGRYNLISPVRDETIADRHKRPKRKNIGFASTTGRFASASDEALLTERLKPQNLRTEQRSQLHLTGHISS